MGKKLKVGSIQKTKAGKKVFVATAFELKNLVQVLQSDEVKALINSNDPKAKKYFNMETKQEQLDGLQAALAAGRLDEKQVEDMSAKVQNTPDYVLSDISTFLN